MKRRQLFKTVLGALVFNGYFDFDSRIPKILLPSLRRRYPKIVKSEIVDICPMGPPSSRIHFVSLVNK